MAERRPVPRERPPREDPGTGREHPQTRSPLIAFALLLSGATAAIFLAGGAEQGNLGVFLLSAGAAMICCPPRTAMRRGIAWAAAALFLCSAGALLPAHFFHVPVWRRALAGVPDLPLAGTVSAAPSLTVFWLTILGCTLLTGLFALTQPVRSRGLFAFALAAVGVCGGYAALGIYAKLTGWVYPFSGGATFGFLPNRNHTATLLITGSVLSIGILGVAFRQRRWVAVDAAVATLALCVTVLSFFSESRGGIVFLLLGVGGWVAGLGHRHRNRPLLVATMITLLVAGGLFLSLKSRARDRLFRSVSMTTASKAEKTGKSADAETENRSGTLSADDRRRIYRDTLGMIRDVPLLGTGLGTFSLVFPAYRRTAINGNLMLHPESDWLMVAAETGLPALGCLGLLVLLTFRGWKPAREHPYWPLHWAFLVAALTAAAHGFVDVPVHRAALGWWVLVLAGLALQIGRSQPERARDAVGWGTRSVFILGGVLSVGLGARLVWAEWLGGAPMPPYVARRAQREIVRTFERGDVEAAMEQAREAVKVSPLTPPLYYQLGVLLLRYEETEAETDRAFGLQRLLSPFPPEVPQAQGNAWLPIDPVRSVALFTEALDRQERLPQGSIGKVPIAPYVRDLMIQATGVPEAQRGLWKTANERGPEGVLGWLEGGNAEVVQERLPLIAADEASWKLFKPEQRRRFLAIWKSKGDREALDAFLEAHKDAPTAGENAR